MKPRNMLPQDLDRITELELLCFSTPWTKKLFEEELARPDTCRWLVLEQDEKIVAYMGWWKIIDEAHVTNLAVDPLFRNKGLGRCLIKEVLNQAQQQGCNKATLEVRPSNTAAVSLYQSFGFENAALRPGYYSDDGEDALLMWLNPIKIG